MADINRYLLEQLKQDPGVPQQPGNMDVINALAVHPAKHIFNQIRNLEQSAGEGLPTENPTNLAAQSFNTLANAFPAGAARVGGGLGVTGSTDMTRGALHLMDIRKTREAAQSELEAFQKARDAEGPSSMHFPFISEHINDMTKTIAQSHDMEKRLLDAMRSASPGMELGAIGGTGWNSLTREQKDAMMTLSNRETVRPEDVQNYLKSMGVTSRLNRADSTETQYLKMQDPNATSEGLTEFQRQGQGIPEATMRFPRDEHMGPTKNAANEFSLYDTGTRMPSIGRAARNVTNSINRHPGIYVNELGQGYGEREAMEQAMNLRFSRAPNEGNWLTSPDYAPYGRGYPVTPTQTKAMKEPPNPDQLDFLKALLGP